MTNYIDGFAFPIKTEYLEEYKAIALKVANVWKQHGAIEYKEFISDSLQHEGLISFESAIHLKEGEQIIFGWVVFPSKKIRDLANSTVPKDPIMQELVKPLLTPEKVIFEASRMVYGGFKSFI